MARRANAPEQISTMITTPQRQELERVAAEYHLSVSAAMRRALDHGIPHLIAEYPPQAPQVSEEERARLEMARAARRG